VHSVVVSRFPSVPPCPSLKPYIHLSFVVFPFHTLGLNLFSRSCPSLSFRHVRHGRTPHFRPKRKAEQPCRPSPVRLRAVFPPFCHALHPRHTYYLRCISTRLDLAYFRGRARTSVFGTCAMGEPLVFGPNARPNSHVARRRAPPCRFPSVPSCPSLKAYIHLSFGVFPHAWTQLIFEVVPQPPFAARAPWRTPRFQPKR
jgi:hypothetical protein